MNDPRPRCWNRFGGHEINCPSLSAWVDEAIRDFQRAMDTDGGLTLPAWQAKWGRRVYNAVV